MDDEKDKGVEEKLEEVYKKTVGTMLKLKEENRRLREENENLKKENEKLRKTIKYLEDKISQILEKLDILESE